MGAVRTEAGDKAAIRAIVDGWIIWRDAAQWDQLLNAWHPGGRMSSTRFEGVAADFVAQTQRAYAAGAKVRHTQSGFWCELSGDHAFSVTGMAILQRASLHGVAIDVGCTGYFLDFFSFRDGRWALDRRQPAYDRDRVDPVAPGAVIPFDEARLAAFPEPYRHLAYIQDSLGLSINMDLPLARGPSFDALMAEAWAWLKETPQ